MSVGAVGLMVKVPVPLRKQAHAVAKLRGETLSDVVRLALKKYVQEALDDARAHRELDALVTRMDAGLESLRDHEDVWTENAITQTRTWALCGTLEVAEPEPEYVTGHDEQGRPITNYAEHVDDVLYRGR